MAVVVAIVVWALSFDFFFTYKGTVFSFGVALAAGVIAGFILSRITTKVGIQIVIVAVIALAATFAASKFVQKPVCIVKQPKLKCGSAQVDPECFIANKNTTFEWDTSGVGVAYTVKIDEFKKKYWPIPIGFKAHPLNADSYSGNNHKNISASVKDKSGYYKYRIVCSQSGKPDEIKDPMIKVP
jgi:hypothetical protein